MRDALRTCLQIAGGLTEATRRRATAAAKELLDQTGIDVDELQRRIGDRIPRRSRRWRTSSSPPGGPTAICCSG